MLTRNFGAPFVLAIQTVLAASVFFFALLVKSGLVLIPMNQ
jgi:hypothetical protein